MTYKDYELRKGSVTSPAGITVNGILIIKGDSITIAQDIEMAKRYIDSKTR